MKPGRPKRGESVPSATVKTWLDAEQLDLVQRRGGGPYVRRLILADLPTRTEPVEEHRYKVGRSMVEVKVPADAKARIMELGGSAYVRHLVRQACQQLKNGYEESCRCCGFYSPKDEVLRE